MTNNNDLPTPTGYRILIALPEVSETISGSFLVKPTQMANNEQAAAVVGKVLAMGPDCYADTRRFPNGAWCKVGDWVMYRSYSGSRFLIDGIEYRIINDDTVEAVVDSPEKYTRI